MIEFINMTDKDIIFPLRFYGEFMQYKILPYGRRIITLDELRKHKESCKYHNEKVKDSYYIRLIKEGWVSVKRIRS